jgi:Protein of unknown function (DUF2842)
MARRLAGEPAAIAAGFATFDGPILADVIPDVMADMILAFRMALNTLIFITLQVKNGGVLRGKPSREHVICIYVQMHYLTVKRGLPMPIRLKKLIGTFLLLGLVIVYALLATMIAVAQLAQSSWVTHLAFFTFSGLLWILPAMVIIKWMAGPQPAKE